MVKGSKLIDFFRQFRVGMKCVDDGLHRVSRCDGLPMFGVGSAQIEVELGGRIAVFEPVGQNGGQGGFTHAAHALQGDASAVTDQGMIGAEIFFQRSEFMVATGKIGREWGKLME
jgi:hypothetical protein